MTDELYPSLQSADVSAEPSFSTELVGFDAGFSQSRQVRQHPLYKFQLQYPLLRTGEFDDLLNFFLARRGAFETFLFQDHNDVNPRGRVFGVATGTQTRYQLPHNKTENVVIRADGSPVAAVYVDPLTGQVVFDAAPASDAVLSYDADDAAYRVRFAADALPYDAEKFFAYGATVTLQQVSDTDARYPIDQRVFGGTLTHQTLDTTGEGIGFSFAAPRAMAVVTLSWYCQAVTAAGTVKVSLCADSSGAPGAVLTSATHVPAAPGWQKITVPSYSITQGTRYWVTVEAASGTWDGTHFCTVTWTAAVPYIATLDHQDGMLWGGYQVADLSAQNTPHSWLGVSLQAGGVWGARDAAGHGAFWLNVAGTVAGHCQDPLLYVIYGALRMRFWLPLGTTHDIVIDRVGGVFSTAGVPADDLDYRIEFLSAPGVTVRSGTLASAVSTGGGQVYIEKYLSTPLTVPTGETLCIDFYSPSALVGAPWTIYGTRWNVGSAFATGWDADWTNIVYGSPTSLAEGSNNAGATWALFSVEGAWAVRCRGWWDA